ncbi:MAG: hypothetical protein V7784_02295 [Oceanospirillaceae bacterium]
MMAGAVAICTSMQKSNNDNHIIIILPCAGENGAGFVTKHYD